MDKIIFFLKIKNENINKVVKVIFIVIYCCFLNYFSDKINFLSKIKKYVPFYLEDKKEKIIFVHGKKILYCGYIKINSNVLNKKDIATLRIKKDYFLLNKKLNNFIISSNHVNVDQFIAKKVTKKKYYGRKRRY